VGGLSKCCQLIWGFAGGSYHWSKASDTPPRCPRIPPPAWRTRLTDFNNDNAPDLAVASIAGLDTNVYVMLNNGTGTINAALLTTRLSNCGVMADLVAADFDGEGSMDLAVACGDGALFMLAGKGDGTFFPVTLTL
jgi:hypothetical protein